MSETSCSSSSSAANGFDYVPEYVLESLMDSFSNDSYVDESLFVECDIVCICQLVIDSIDEDCDDSSPRIGDVFDAFSDDDNIDDVDDIGQSVTMATILIIVHTIL